MANFEFDERRDLAMKKVVSLALVLLFLLLPVSSFTAFAAESGDIVILYENDVHCAAEGYSKVSAMKKELSQTYNHVGVVSVGDFVQGGALGSFSRGEYMVELQNLVGYDALTLGNHEFDYRLPRLMELVDMMNTKPVSCNFQKMGEETSYFDPYVIVPYGDVKIAYIGVTTPETITSSSPAQFKDEQGNYVFTFNKEKLYRIVQKNIDAAVLQGADYVIGLTHIGYDETGTWDDIQKLIANTTGFDVVLDGHSHSVIPGLTVADKGGNQVVLTSTGTKFEYVGKLTITEKGEFSTELIPLADYDKTDASIDAYLKKINEEYSVLGDRKIAYSQVDLITHDKDGNRLVRTAETNLGNLCADAFRLETGADIGYINGGGIRAPIDKGDITYNEIFNVYPYGNTVCVAEVTGKALRDLLEMATMNYPLEDGSFPHLSGMTFSLNTAIPTSVVLDENGNFVKVDGTYRVYNIKVFNRETNQYESLEENKIYTLASHNYLLLEQGGGMSMLADAEIILNNGMVDVELLEQYIVNTLGGVVGQQYENVVSHITFTQGEVIEQIPPVIENTENTENPKTEEANTIVMVAVLSAAAFGGFLATKKKRV